MADTADYLEVYRKFFEHFAATVNPHDQLPVKVAGYYLSDYELVGEIVDWTLQYLNQKKCPPSLVAHITRIVIDEMRMLCKNNPTLFRTQDNTYQPLKLMQAVTRKVDEVCLSYRDGDNMNTLPPPGPELPISTCAIKNTRRCMEDRHVIIEDLHGVFNIKDQNPASYYAVFDGHAGPDAAVYSVCHLHQFLAESPFYPTDPVSALKEAFIRTDRLFIEKSAKEHLRSGTTAVCALLRPKEKKLYVAWLGDSQAILVSEGKAVQIVDPHKPDREDERQRIEDMGGCVFFWGTWRVDGQLAVSRAIGDPDYKPYVTADPDVITVDLTGKEDFLVLACDGLWDFVREEEAVVAVYEQIRKNPGDLEGVSQRLVQLSKQQGSTDNISVIIVFLTAPSLLASRSLNESRQRPSLNNGPQYQAVRTMENETSTNPFTNGASEEVSCQKGLLLDLGTNNDGNTFKQNGKKTPDLFFLGCPPNGRVTEDDDLGPETDVDAVDDVQLSPCNSNPFEDNPRIPPKVLDFESLDEEPRKETPTPPADEVTGVTGLVPDNVAESGEESEDEWNYYRVEPTGKQSETDSQKQQPQQQATLPVCEQPAEKAVTEDISESADMESQLNPNAAEFIPSPTQHRSIEQFLQSKTTTDVDASLLPPLPTKIEGAPKVPFASDSFNTISPNEKLPDLLNGQKAENEHLEELSGGLETVSDDADFGKTPELVTTAFEEVDQLQRDTQISRDILCSAMDQIQDIVDASSIVEESHDPTEQSSNPFVTELNNSNKSGVSSPDEHKILADEVPVDSLCLKDPMSEVPTSPEESLSSTHENEVHIESNVLIDHNLILESPAVFDMGSSLHAADKAREPIHISFELQKDIAPEMESQPELVKLNIDNSLGFEVHEPVVEETNLEAEVTLETELVTFDSPVGKDIALHSESVDAVNPEFDGLCLQSSENDNMQDEMFMSDKIDFITPEHEDLPEAFVHKIQFSAEEPGDVPEAFMLHKIEVNAEEHEDVPEAFMPDKIEFNAKEHRDVPEAFMPEKNGSNVQELQGMPKAFMPDEIEFSAQEHGDVPEPFMPEDIELNGKELKDVPEAPDLFIGVAFDNTIKAEAVSPNAIQTPPLTPTFITGVEISKIDTQNEFEVIEKLPEMDVEKNSVVPETMEKLSEVGVKSDDLERVIMEKQSEVSAAPESSDVIAVAATVVTAVAAGADVKEKKSEEPVHKDDFGVIESKKESALATKKPGSVKAKKPLSEKAKPLTKVTGSQKPTPSKTATSPTKSASIPAAAKTIAKKSPASSPLNRLSKPSVPPSPTPPSSNKPKTNGVLPKSSPGLPKPKPTITSSGSPTNDTGRPAAKRPESASNKISTGTSIASKTRPISAPALTPKTTKPAANKPATTNVRQTPAPANGSVTKSKLSTLPPRPKPVTQTKPSVKEGKESVNKQISSSRITSVKPSTLPNVSRTLSQSTTRKSVANSSSVLKATSTTVKTTSKVGVKKSTVTSVTSTSSLKTKASAASPNKESIKEVTSVINSDVKSDNAIFENAEIAE